MLSAWWTRFNSPHGSGSLGGILGILVPTMSVWWNRSSAGLNRVLCGLQVWVVLMCGMTRLWLLWWSPMLLSLGWFWTRLAVFVVSWRCLRGFFRKCDDFVSLCLVSYLFFQSNSISLSLFSLCFCWVCGSLNVSLKFSSFLAPHPILKSILLMRLCD